MTEYKCYKCLYKTDKKNNIIYHFNRKNKCMRSNNCSYTDSEIIILNNKQLNNESSNKNVCNYCSKTFTHSFNLNKHIKKFHNNLFIDKLNIENLNIETNNIENNNIINITNNITLNVIKPVLFNEEWDLSEIDKNEKQLFLFSKIMYTKLLEYILNNKNNLNVIVDNCNNSALVYTENNNEKKYINMDIKEIIDMSMEKLNKNLIDILKDSSNLNLDYLDLCEKNINEKYQKFIENKETQEIVSKYISNIYEKKKDDALEIMKIINENEKIGY